MPSIRERRLGAFLLATLLLSLPARAGETARPAGAHPDYPLPPASHLRLFFLQRSSNANTVVYDARLDADARLDPDRPVEVYWLRYNTSGKRRALNWLERNFAYGVSARPDPARAGHYLARVAALEGRRFRVRLDDEGRASAELSIAGRPARLHLVYVALDGKGAFADVRHVDLHGEDLETGAPVRERIARRGG